MADRKPYEPFAVVRVRQGGHNLGPDKIGDLFCVSAKGNQELVRTGETPTHALLNGNTSRETTQKLCDALNVAFTKFWHGIEE